MGGLGDIKYPMVADHNGDIAKVTLKTPLYFEIWQQFDRINIFLLLLSVMSNQLDHNRELYHSERDAKVKV